jgi:formylmethanofuran dehydrogenase subunit A
MLRILGLQNKGHLTIGADADITIVELSTQQPVMTVSNGKIIMKGGKIFGNGTRMITTPAGASFVKSKGLKTLVVDPKASPFYRKQSLSRQLN